MIVLLIALLLSFAGIADSTFHLNAVNVDCKASVPCSLRTTRFKELVGDYRSIVHLKDTLKVMASDGGYQSFTYSLDKKEDKYELNIRFLLKPIIQEISIGFTDRNLEIDPIQLVNIREGEFFEIQKLKESMDALKKRLEGMGFPNNSESYEVIEKKEKVDINIVVTLGQPRIFKNITTDTKSIFVSEYLKRKFLNMYNRPFDINSFKLYLDDAQRELFNYGYYLIGLDFTPEYKKDRVLLKIKVTNDEIFAFDFKNLHREHRDVIHALVVDLFRKYKRPLTESTLTSALKDHYKDRALLNAKVKIETTDYKNNSNETVQLYRIYFDENGKTRLTDVKFNGNIYFSKKKLKRMFEKEAFELASVHFFDKEYFTYFQEYLKTQYIRRGFVQAQVFDPAYTFGPHKEVASVEYNIQEGQRAFVRKVEFDGVPEELQDNITAILDNKIEKPFNPISMLEDIKTVATYLQEQGYYYAEVTNANEPDLVRYSKSGADVFLKFMVDPGPVLRLNRVLYLGNDKTRKKVLAKKIRLEKGDIITPTRTREIESALSATGLFNSVGATPLKHTSKNAATDLLVKVSERDYGLIEIAPGYRTDLGFKLTGTVTYQNIGGYNRSVTLRSQLNRRTSFTTVDPKRREGLDQILEHNETVTYNQGDIWDTLIDGAASMGYQTRRFYAFDANIFRLNGTLTRDITKRFSTSLRYQYEDITQYNATDEINNGSFQIGAITPSLTYDLRNSQVNPLRGAFFNLSTEFANPYFGSQKQPDLTINYYKLMSRNRFYIPYKYGTLALSATVGMEENLSNKEVSVNGVEQKEGYIPTIKVFRLTGMDIIRGYTDTEMNQLPDGRDISAARVDGKAYMALFKVEPRYFINDSLMTGVFYDAGRVFVNHMDLGELRDSVGVTFKILTPVGTLDFDYGIKLLRKRDANGNLEDPGRFHVSIGFF